MYMVLILVNNRIAEVAYHGDDYYKAELNLIAACKENIREWDEYNIVELNDILECGYERFKVGGNTDACIELIDVEDIDRANSLVTSLLNNANNS